MYLLCRSALTPGGRRKAWRRWPQTSRSICRILWILLLWSLSLSSSSLSYLELRSDLRRKLAVLELPLWLPGRLLLPCLNITLVSRTLSILAKGLQTGIEQQGSESDQNSDIPNIHIERNNDPIKHVNVIILIW